MVAFSIVSKAGSFAAGPHVTADLVLPASGACVEAAFPATPPATPSSVRKKTTLEVPRRRIHPLMSDQGRRHVQSERVRTLNLTRGQSGRCFAFCDSAESWCRARRGMTLDNAVLPDGPGLSSLPHARTTVLASASLAACRQLVP